ncbi:MAG TPA: hypothetical protein VES38_08455 [Methylotenera sp.]|nr:hypothetical protein [Methylotenera sp.]
MLHRLVFAFSLIVSFGMAQIGAVTHEISHYGDTKSQSQPLDFSKSSYQSGQNDLAPDNQAPHNQVCDKCLSYAEIGHAVQNADVILPITVSSQYYLNNNSATPSYAKLRSYSARAPPTLA